MKSAMAASLGDFDKAYNTSRFTAVVVVVVGGNRVVCCLNNKSGVEGVEVVS